MRMCDDHLLTLNLQITTYIIAKAGETRVTTENKVEFGTFCLGL